MEQNGAQNRAKINKKTKKNADENQHDFGRVFFIDFCDFRAHLGPISKYFLALFQKVEKA